MSTECCSYYLRITILALPTIAGHTNISVVFSVVFFVNAASHKHKRVICINGRIISNAKFETTTLLPNKNRFENWSLGHSLVTSTLRYLRTWWFFSITRFGICPRYLVSESIAPTRICNTLTGVQSSGPQQNKEHVHYILKGDLHLKEGCTH